MLLICFPHTTCKIFYTKCSVVQCIHCFHQNRSHLSISTNVTHPSITYLTGNTEERGKFCVYEPTESTENHTKVLKAKHKGETASVNPTNISYSCKKKHLKLSTAWLNWPALYKTHICAQTHINAASKQLIAYPGPDPGELVSCDWDYGQRGLATAICIFLFAGSQVALSVH